MIRVHGGFWPAIDSWSNYQQAELSRFDPGDKTVVPTPAVSFFGESRVEVLGNLKKRKKLFKLKGSEALRCFGEWVFNQISPIKSYQVYAVFKVTRCIEVFLSKGNKFKPIQGKLKSPVTQPPLKNSGLIRILMCPIQGFLIKSSRRPSSMYTFITVFGKGYLEGKA